MNEGSANAAHAAGNVSKKNLLAAAHTESAPTEAFVLVPLEIRNYQNLAIFASTIMATVAFMVVLLFYLISGRSIIGGPWVTSRSLTTTLVVVGYISKGYSAMVSVAVINCVTNSISDRLLDRGVPAQVVADNVYSTDQGLFTLASRFRYPAYNWPILVVFVVSLLISGSSKASLQLTAGQGSQQVVSSYILDNKGCSSDNVQDYIGCLSTPVGAFVNATNVGLVAGGDPRSRTISKNMFVPCTNATANGTCFATPIPLILAIGPSMNTNYTIRNTGALAFTTSCQSVEYVVGGVTPNNQTFPFGVGPNGVPSFLAATNYTGNGALLTVGMSIDDGNFICNVYYNSCTSDITWSGGIGEWQATGAITGAAENSSTTDIGAERVQIIPAQLADIFTLETLQSLTFSQNDYAVNDGPDAGYLIDVLGYAGMVAAALECGYDYSGVTGDSFITTLVDSDVNAIVVDGFYAGSTVVLLGINLIVLFLLVWSMRSLYMPLNFTQLVCMASRVSDEKGLLRFRTGGKPEFTGLISISLEDNEASLQIGPPVANRVDLGASDKPLRDASGQDTKVLDEIELGARSQAKPVVDALGVETPHDGMGSSVGCCNRPPRVSHLVRRRVEFNKLSGRSRRWLHRRRSRKLEGPSDLASSADK